MNEPSMHPLTDEEMNAIRQEAMEFAGIGLYRYRFDGTVLFMDLGAMRILEITDRFAGPAEVVGRNIADLIIYLDAPGRLRQQLRRRRRLRGFEYRFQTLDGRRKWALHDSYIVHDQRTGEEVIQVIVRDISRRKQAEEALREREERYRYLIEKQGEGLGFVDAEERFVFSNPVGEEIFGVPPGTLAGRSLLDFLGPEARQVVEEQSRRRRQGERATYELQIRRPDGEERLILLTVTPWIDDAGRFNGAIGVFRDETERRRTLQELRDSEERYRALAESAQDHIFIYDRDGRLLYVNAFGAAILGRKPEELIGIRLQELFGGPQITRMRENMESVFHTGRSVSVEAPVTFAGGALWLDTKLVPLLDDAGRVRAVIGVSRDVTARQRAEQELRRYAERLRGLRIIDQAILAARSPEAIAEAAARWVRALLPAVRVSVATLDPATGEAVVLAADGVAVERLGPGTRVRLDPGILERLRAGETVRAMAGGAPVAPGEPAETLAAAGVSATVSLPLLARDELIGFLSLAAAGEADFGAAEIEIAREAADSVGVALVQARLLAEIQRHAQELEKRVAERTSQLQETGAELEAFAYSISHGLRSPLLAIDGYVHALERALGPQLGAPEREDILRICAAVERMDGLIEDLLTYSQLARAELRLQPVQLETAVENALSQHQAAIQSRQARIEVVRPLPPVIGHPHPLTQAVAHLLSNALKFVPEGTAPEIRLWAEADSGRVRLWCGDNGIGIAPEHHERIFRVFERLHSRGSYGGRGIGLAIVRKAVQRLGGRVGVESGPGQGSRFWIELPRLPDSRSGPVD